jgi:hypothetical protein
VVGELGSTDIAVVADRLRSRRGRLRVVVLPVAGPQPVAVARLFGCDATHDKGVLTGRLIFSTLT